MEAALPAILGSAASALVGGLFSKTDKPKSVAPPTVAPVTAMPDPGAQAKALQRRKAASLYGQQLSAESTILSGGSDRLGA